MERSLKDLSPGDMAKVVKVNAKGAIRRRLVDMGVVPGAEFRVERYAPLGDPIELKLKGYYLSLRREEAEGIIVDDIGGV